MKRKYLIICIIIIIGLFSFFNFNNQNEIANIYNSIIFIDPGHGGKDNGTSYNDIFEDELNLKLSTMLYEKIINLNGIAYLSRINDYDLSSMYAKNHKIEDLNRRIKYIENSKCDLFISLHLNYYPSNNVNGLQTFYQKNNERSKLLANCIQNKVNALNKKNKSIKPGDYYILNNCNVSGVLLEFGFLSSEYDRNRLNDEKYLNQICELVISGIDEYLLNNKEKI